MTDLIQTHLEEFEEQVENFDHRDDTGIEPDFTPAIALLSQFIAFVAHMHDQSKKDNDEQNFMEKYAGDIINVDVTFESYFRYNFEPPKELDYLEDITDSADMGKYDPIDVMQAIEKAVAKGLPESIEQYLDKCYQNILNAIPDYQAYKSMLVQLDAISDEQFMEGLSEDDEIEIEALSVGGSAPSQKFH
jgi:hypothetical protein